MLLRKNLTVRFSIKAVYKNVTLCKSYIEYSRFFFFFLVIKYYLKNNIILINNKIFNKIDSNSYSVNKSVFVNNKSKMKLIEATYTNSLTFDFIIKNHKLFDRSYFINNSNLYFYNYYLDNANFKFFKIQTSYFCKNI